MPATGPLPSASAAGWASPPSSRTRRNAAGSGSPVPAVRGLLERTGPALAEVEIVERNEACAPQVLAGLRDLEIAPGWLNRNGGAIALGHPIGATGARIVVTLLHEMRRSGARYGIATLCVSGGTGVAALFENLQ